MTSQHEFVSPMPMEIEAGPISLRSREVGDVSAYVDALRASWTELSEWFPWAQSPLDPEHQTTRAQVAWDAFVSGEDYEFALFERSTDALVGSVRLNPTAEPSAAGIGYWVRSDRTGRGYATAAARAATDAAFIHLQQIDRVLIHMDVANVKSASVARGAGYSFEGEGDLPIEAPGRTGRGLFWTMTRDRWASNYRQ